MDHDHASPPTASPGWRVAWQAAIGLQFASPVPAVVVDPLAFWPGALRTSKGDASPRRRHEGRVRGPEDDPAWEQYAG